MSPESSRNRIQELTMADAGTCNTKCCGKPSCPREGSKCVCTNCKCAKGECLPKCDKNCCGGSEQCASKCGNANCKCGADCKCEPDQCSAECKKGCCGDDYHFTQMKSALCDYSNAGCDYC